MLTWLIVGAVSIYIGLGVYLLVSPYDRAHDPSYAVYGSSAFFAPFFLFSGITPVVLGLMITLPVLVWARGLTSH